MPRSARAWRDYYEHERVELGEAGLLALLDAAPAIELPPRGALIFPHTRLRETGAWVAAVARAVVSAGAERVLAIGVLHGAREHDAALMKRARAGEPGARMALRRVHGPGAPGDAGHADEEFSLDGFAALLARAARRAGRATPRLITRFPLLVGDDPGSLPGIDELVQLREQGCAVVATTDPIHHGVGYGTADVLRARESPETHAWARATIERAGELLAHGEWRAFARHAEESRSDFRDAGPLLAALLGTGFAAHVHDVELVDYAAALRAPQPTWVAGALMTFR